MTEFTNNYFKEMETACREWQKAKERRNAERAALVAADDWDELKEWSEREKSYIFPFTSGEMKALCGWKNSANTDIFAVDELPWEGKDEAEDFIEAMREAGVEEFAITDRSTALMDALHELAEAGCEMKGLRKVKKTENYYGEMRTETLNGILMRIG